MGSSIFTSNTTALKSSLELATTHITLGGTMTGLVAQSVNANMTRSIQHMFEVGSTDSYYIAGRPQGNGSLANIIGPTDASISTIATLGQLCDPKDLEVIPHKYCETGASGRGGGGGGKSASKYIFKNAVLTGITIAAAPGAQDMINGTWQYIFTDVEMGK